LARSLLTLLARRYVVGVIYAFMQSGGTGKIAPMVGATPIAKKTSVWYVDVPDALSPVPLTLFCARRKSQVKAIDESEGLKPEALDQMKRELTLLQGKVVASIEKELKAASDKGEVEREAVVEEANALIACINADSKRLRGDSAKVVGRAEEMMADLLQAMAGVHKGKGEHEEALETYEKALVMSRKAWCVRVRSSEPEELSRAPRNVHR
jgi:hypothetical protein